MKKLLTTSLALIALSSPAFAADDVAADQDMTATEVSYDAMADIINNDGETVGHAKFKQGTIGVLGHFTFDGLPAGKHGFHIHKIGTCDASEKFTTAKGHIDPSEKEHGFLNPAGPEEGDLPNIIVPENGQLEIELFMPQIDVSGDGTILLDEDGSSLMIHENPDDHMTQPIGGAGARIACGVIKAAE